MTRRIAVRGVIIRDGQLFCMKLTANSHLLDKNYWCLPGGGIDDGESLYDAIRREMIEETAVEPEIGNLLFIQQFAEPEKHKEHLEFFFHIKNADDYLNVDLSKTTHGVQEIEEYGFVDPKTSNILPDFIKEIDYSDIANTQTKIFNRL